MERYYVIFTGRVQGVGFRYTAMMLAQKQQVTGWARNLENGNVEMELQGEESAILSVIRDLTKGTNWIRVDDYVMRKIALQDEEKGFRAVY